MKVPSTNSAPKSQARLDQQPGDASDPFAAGSLPPPGVASVANVRMPADSFDWRSSFRTQIKAESSHWVVQ
jgi:hypothetical protein